MPFLRGFAVAIGLGSMLVLGFSTSRAQVIGDIPRPPRLSRDQLNMVRQLAQIQGPSMGTGLGGGSVSIAFELPVQKELALTESQRARLARLAAACEKDRDEAASAQLDDKSRESYLMDRHQDYEREVARILGRGRKARLHQIALQRMGPWVAADPEVADKINLSLSQQLFIQELMNQHNAIRRASWAALCERAWSRPAVGVQQQDITNLRKDFDNLRVQAFQQIKRTMTPKQRDALEEQLGEPFDPMHPRPRGDTPAPTQVR